MWLHCRETNIICIPSIHREPVLIPECIAGIWAFILEFLRWSQRVSTWNLKKWDVETFNTQDPLTASLLIAEYVCLFTDLVSNVFKNQPKKSVFSGSDANLSPFQAHTASSDIHARTCVALFDFWIL